MVFKYFLFIIFLTSNVCRALDLPNNALQGSLIIFPYFNADAVIIPERYSPQATPVLAKSASGALEKIPLIRVTNLSKTLEYLKKEGYWCAGLVPDANLTLAEAKLSGKIVLVLGAEGGGIRRLTREKCDYLLRIPINLDVDSLNISAAAAISLYELNRV